MSANETRLTSLLGEAVKNRWGDLPQPIQECLFETALRCADGTHNKNTDELRQELALLLHGRHPRTAEHA